MEERRRHLEDRIYEYAAGRMGEPEYRGWMEHVDGCPECKEKVAELKKLLTLLDQFESPPLTDEFKDELARKLRKVPIPPKPWIEKIREWFQVPQLKWGVAMAAVVLLSLVGVINYYEEKERVDRTPKGIVLVPEIEAVKNPIVIETANIQEAFEKLKEILQAHQANLVRTRPVNAGMEITFKVGEDEEEGLLKGLSRLGKVDRKEEGFKDKEGNIVVILKKQGE